MNLTKKAAVGSQDVCGVWLDTGHLRGQRKRPSLTRPISKLLNPLAPSHAYSVAVSLSFTQTKLQLPPTKQTSITSFFTPRPTEAKAAESSCSEHMSASSMAVSDGRKRKRSMAEADCATRATSHSDPQDGPAYQDIRPCVWGSLERQCHSDEEEQPALKKRLAGHCPILPGPDTEDMAPRCGSSSLDVAAESTKPLLSDYFTQDSQGNRVLAHRATPVRQTMEDGLESEWQFGALLSRAGKTSTQRRHGASAHRALCGEPREEGKENSSASAWAQDLSPVKHSSASAWAQGPSPVKHSSASVWAQGPSPVKHSSASAWAQSPSPVKHSSASAWAQGPSPVKHSSASAWAQGPSPVKHSSASAWAQGPSPVKHSSASAWAQGPSPVKHSSASAWAQGLSPVKHSSASAWAQDLSPVKHRPCSSPRSPLRRREVSCPLPRRQALRRLQEDKGNSYDMLFTQDSQGQRVIAHHGFRPRSPLKDWANTADCHFWTGSSRMSGKELEDSEPEILFTQDSEGNVVIKH